MGRDLDSLRGLSSGPGGVHDGSCRGSGVVDVRLVSVLNTELRHPEPCHYSVIYSRFTAITDVTEVLYHEA